MRIEIAKVIGHRGACGYAPENTLASMQKAHELGVEWVEFDVMLTQDSKAIIMHDNTLDRTTNGKGNVADTLYKNIAKLDAGSSYSAEFFGERVPTFVELLNFLTELNLKMIVEIKATPGKEIETAKEIIKLLQQHWQGPTPIVSSASILSLKTVAKMSSQFPLGWVTGQWFEDWQKTADELNCFSIHINQQVLTHEKIAAIKKTGRLVLSYTINNTNLAKLLFFWGVDAVFSDFPDKIIKVSGSR